MIKPVVQATTLVTEDGVPIDAIHLPGPRDLAIIVAHGFTLSWQRPNVWRVANRFNHMAGVITFDFRGHGRSGGLSTLGDREIHDLDVAVAWARELGYQRIAAVGFSMGASVVLRHAGLIGGLDAVVSVSGPGRWYYRGTERMRWVHRAVERRAGRYVTRRWLNTRINPEGWKLIPVPPAEAAAKIAPVPLLIVHGDQDRYFTALERSETRVSPFATTRRARRMCQVCCVCCELTASSRTLCDQCNVSDGQLSIRSVNEFFTALQLCLWRVNSLKVKLRPGTIPGNPAQNDHERQLYSAQS